MAILASSPCPQDGLVACPQGSGEAEKIKNASEGAGGEVGEEESEAVRADEDKSEAEGPKVDKAEDQEDEEDSEGEEDDKDKLEAEEPFVGAEDQEPHVDMKDYEVGAARAHVGTGVDLGDAIWWRLGCMWGVMLGCCLGRLWCLPFCHYCTSSSKKPESISSRGTGRRNNMGRCQLCHLHWQPSECNIAGLKAQVFAAHHARRMRLSRLVGVNSALRKWEVPR